jgi:hypothetical protein
VEIEDFSPAKLLMLPFLVPESRGISESMASQRGGLSPEARTPLCSIDRCAINQLWLI